MRIKPILKLFTQTEKFAVAVFTIFYTIGMLVGTISSHLAIKNIDQPINQTFNPEEYATIGIFSFLIFMIVCSIINSQKETRFFISRSLSRKEIFLANSIIIALRAVIMSIIFMLTACLDNFVSHVIYNPMPLIGIKSDAISLIAPDAGNIFMFFALSFSIMFLFGCITYLYGTLLAKWKTQTVGVSIILALVFVGMLIIENFSNTVIEIFINLFTDGTSGLFVILKLLLIAVCVLIVTFPIQRRITAAKQS